MIRRLTLLLLVLAAAPAHAADGELVVRGAGYGHGVGMSQYGAMGLAQQGKSAREILAHYYTGTTLGTSPTTRVRVLLASPKGGLRVTNARRAGRKRLRASSTYELRRRGATSVSVHSASGRRLGTYPAPLVVRGAKATGPVQIVGGGAYRGRLNIHPGTFGGLDVVNAVTLEDYVRGVVARESPASWPAAALEAQSIAARTYAITTAKKGGIFDQYPDERSQVYGGVAAETPTTDAAVAATRGQVVMYDGKPAVTFFFSTSGGRTEDVENVFPAAGASPWLRSVEDPTDKVSPKHRWRVRFSVRSAERKLGNLVRGRFVGIDVRRRGTSPRVLEADVIGTGGRVRATGPQLRARLGLFDTWASFTTVTADDKAPPKQDEESPDPQSASDPSGGVSPSARSAHVASIAGRAFPAGPGRLVVVQRRHAGAWVDVASAEVTRGGRYRAGVREPGRYRVRYAGVTTRSLRIR